MENYQYIAAYNQMDVSGIVALLHTVFAFSNGKIARISDYS